MPIIHTTGLGGNLPGARKCHRPLTIILFFIMTWPLLNFILTERLHRSVSSPFHSSSSKILTEHSDTRTVIDPPSSEMMTANNNPFHNNKEQQTTTTLLFRYHRIDSGIDVVYSWVNGSDPIRQADLEKYKHLNQYKNGGTPNRFHTWNELYYSLRLLYDKVSHIRNIYILTAGERPYYTAEFPQVQYINHSEFLSVLPTFNSWAIEFGQYYLLDRLSDPFVYLNDDYFITSSINLKDFVKDRVWYEAPYRFQQNKSTDFTDSYRPAHLNSNVALKKVFPQHREQNCMAHNPVVVRHETLRFIASNMTQAFEATLRTRFRDGTDLSFQYVLSNVERYLHGDITKFVSSGRETHFFVLDQNLEKLKMNLLTLERMAPKQFLTMNDHIENPTEAHDRLVQNFYQKFLAKHKLPPSTLT